MNFAAAAIGKVATAIGTTASGAAGLAAKAGGGLLSAAKAGTVSQFGGIAGLLQGGLTIASALSAARGGRADAAALNIQAAEAETQIGVEQVNGLERRNSLRRALLQTVADNDVATAASGADLSFGTPVVARREAVRDTERALGVDRSTEDFNVARLQERARLFRVKAGEAKEGGLRQAASLLIEGGIDAFDRFDRAKSRRRK